MQIQLEAPDQNTIRAYIDEQIIVQNTIYSSSCIVSRNIIIPDWNIQSISELDEHCVLSLLELEPEIVIIGHQKPGCYPPFSSLELLLNQRIGIECMSIGSACRTFNVLLSEHRQVVVGFIFSN